MNRVQIKGNGFYDHKARQQVNPRSKPVTTKAYTLNEITKKQSPLIKGRYLNHPNEIQLDTSILRNQSLGVLTPNSARPGTKPKERCSVNSTMNKGKKSIERMHDEQSSGFLDLELDPEDEFTDHPLRINASKINKMLNMNSWNGLAKESSKQMKPYDAISAKSKGNLSCIKDSESTNVASEAGSCRTVDGQTNIVLYFGKPGLPSSMPPRKQSLKTAVSSRRASPFGFKQSDTPSLYIGNPNADSRNTSVEHKKSPATTPELKLTSRIPIQNIQRCQSSRASNKNFNKHNTSAEGRTNITQLLNETRKTEHVDNYRKTVGVDQDERKSNKARPCSPSTYVLQTRPNIALNRGVSPNNVYKQPASAKANVTAANLKKKTGVMSLLNASKQGGYTENKQNIENYKVEKAIGQGSYAVVKLAVCKDTSEKVAIKTYEKFKLNDPQKRKNVKREIDILKSLSHNNIIKLHKTIETTTQLHLVMEFIGTQSLHAYLKPKPLRRINETDARKIFKQIIEGLNYMHQKNIAHRDIKLENLLIDADLNLKIIDFGFSVETSKDKKINILCGTPSYMAPELASRKDYYGHSVDIWAAGILLYVLLAGHFPFRDANEKDLFRKISRGQYDVPGHISEDAKALIKKMLRINPIDRPSCEEILHDKWITGLQTTNPNFKNYLDSKIQHYRQHV